MTGLNGTDLTTLPAAEKRLRAREMAAADPELTGTDLDRLFGMRDRWGRKQAAAARSGTRPARRNGASGTRAARAPGPVRVPAPETGAPERAATGGTPKPAAAQQSGTTRHAEAGQPPTEVVPAGILWVTTAAVILVAAVAAAASFQHMVTLAETVGEDRPWLLPISVDGLVVAASMAMLVQRRAGRKAGPLAKLALGLGLGASLAANMVAVDPSMVDPAVVRRLVAAWPPCSLAISYELLLSVRSPRRTEEKAA